MKKLLLIFILIFLSNCSGIYNQSVKTAIIDCPRVFFSSENNIYVHGVSENIDFDDINYKATLNNYEFVKGCFSGSGIKQYNLELLILVEPLNPINEIINLPVFALIYDSDNNLIDKQYFRINSDLKYNNTLLNYEITEVITNLNINVNMEENIESITLGFVKILK